jgi:hypothetical protein
MMNNRQLPIRLFDLTIIRILFDPQNFVIIFTFGLFEFEFCRADFFGDARFFWVGFGNGF